MARTANVGLRCLAPTAPTPRTRQCSQVQGVYVVHERQLSDVLSDFARTMVTDFPIQSILDHLVQQIVDVLPVTAAGVTLICEGTTPRYVAASDAAALRYEQLQSDLGHGPCIAAYETGSAVTVPDLARDDRFLTFGAAATRAGLAAVFTFPLRHATGCLGALDLYRDTPGPLGEEDLEAAQTLADVAAAYLINAEAREAALTTTARFDHSAHHDALTGLPNRLLLQQRLEHAAQLATRTHSTAAVLFADLDNFKDVNDTYGHAVGDQLLVAVAQRLSALVRPGDTLARFSGDEFVILCENLDHPEQAEALAGRIDDGFSQVFVVADHELTVTASVGLAFAGPGDEITPQLIADADLAMYQAKRNGGAGHQVLDLRAAVHARDHSQLGRDLRAAFDADQLHIVYQPIVRLADGQLEGVEALLRWTDPERGAVPAISFVAVAEQTDLICEIGAWVLDRGCRTRTRWVHEFPDHPVDLAINVSGRQLMAAGFLDTVVRVLTETGMDPTALVLEVTENVVLEGSDRARDVLAGLRALDVRIALDDFGTGYCSFSYLRWLPVDVIKVDQSFVSDIGRTEMGAAMVAAVTHMAHVLGLTVVAEGVESRLQRDELINIGCETGQGYFYARPMTAEEIECQLLSPVDVGRLPARA